MKQIYIGAGCFWGTEGYYSKIKGVISTEAGYLNGNTENPSYKDVTNSSGHAEVVKIEFDPSMLSYEELFNSYIRIIDPFSKNKQGNDVGVQYRIGLYTDDEELLNEMKLIVSRWEESNGKSFIELYPIYNYTTAEEYHQMYLDKNPTGYCHINLRDIPKELMKK